MISSEILFPRGEGAYNQKSNISGKKGGRVRKTLFGSEESRLKGKENLEDVTRYGAMY